jgi:hypothetical protein
MAFKGDVLADNGTNGAEGAKKHEASNWRGTLLKSLAFYPFLLALGRLSDVSSRIIIG